MKRRELLGLLAGVLAFSTLPAIAADEPKREENRERVYGWELMTDAERAEYRKRMRSMHSVEERRAFQLEHHKLMQERARERGVKLPEVPMGPGMRGPGMGPGNGMGPGMGGGMGPRN